MNKRMKDPKGDLRFVHKSTRVYDFWSLKLTAMACRRQAAKKSKQIEPLRICACLPQAAREYSLFFSQSRKVAKRNHTNFAA